MTISRQNYIDVDFENIQELDMDLIADRPVDVVIALGKRQTSLNVELVSSFLKYPDQVRLIQVGVEGKNALDLVLAYYVGQQSLKEPQAYFHILSRDKGFDSLVEHLKSQKILIQRHEKFSEITVLKDPRFAKSPKNLAPIPERPQIKMVERPVALTASALRTPQVVVKSTPAPRGAVVPGGLIEPANRIALIAERLTSNPKNRPVRRKAMLSFIHDFFGKKLTESEADKVFQGLLVRRVISVNAQERITYQA